MRRILAATAVLAILAISAGPATARPQQPLTPCTTEDQTTACIWDAHTRGNHLGRSFKVDQNGVLTYLD